MEIGGCTGGENVRSMAYLHPFGAACCYSNFERGASDGPVDAPQCTGDVATAYSSMAEDLRSEMVTQRISQNTVKIVFRLFTWYEPGGPAERSEVLRRLQSPAEYTSVATLEEALKAVRNWPHWLARCKAVNMTPPDPSVLAKGLMALSQHHIEKSGDSMLRTTLRLDAQPGMDQILAFKQSWKPCRRALLRQLRGQLFLRLGPWTRGVDRRVVGMRLPIRRSLWIFAGTL